MTAYEKCGNDLCSVFSWFQGKDREWIPFSRAAANSPNQEMSFWLSVSALCASSTTAATKQQTWRQSALGLQSLVLRFHILHIKWVWVGLVLARDSHALSQLIPIFRKDVSYQSSLQWLARQEKCKADGVMWPWQGWAGMEGLDCLRAIVM